MILTAEKAKKLIEKERDNMPYVVNHCLCVGDAAGRVISALGLDADKAKALGYVHDIGKRFNLPEQASLVHGFMGYKYLTDLGYDEEDANICILHSYLNNKFECLSGDANKDGMEYKFQKKLVENHEYSIYEKSITLCDLMCKDRVMSMEERLIDVISRYGTCSHTHRYILDALALRDFFSKKIGKNLYDLFPEIYSPENKDNLQNQTEIKNNLYQPEIKKFAKNQEKN